MILGCRDSVMGFYKFETCLIDSSFRISAKAALSLSQEESRIAIELFVPSGRSSDSRSRLQFG